LSVFIQNQAVVLVMILAQYIKLEITMSVNRKERISIKPKLNPEEVEGKISFETKLWLYPCYLLTFSYLVVRGYFSSMSEMEC